jgi:hypothetical protein
MRELGMSMFEPHIGSTFQIVSPGVPTLELTLVEVEDQTVIDRPHDPSLRAQPFSLIFHGPLSPVVRQQILDLEHAILGRMQIFLVPLGPDKKVKEKLNYQAIFN